MCEVSRSFERHSYYVSVEIAQRRGVLAYDLLRGRDARWYRYSSCIEGFTVAIEPRTPATRKYKKQAKYTRNVLIAIFWWCFEPHSCSTTRVKKAPSYFGHNICKLAMPPFYRWRRPFLIYSYSNCRWSSTGGSGCYSVRPCFCTLEPCPLHTNTMHTNPCWNYMQRTVFSY